MTKKQTDKLMSALFTAIAAIVLTGALFKLVHWKYGNEILQFGLILSFILGSIEIARLKKIIKKLESNAEADS